MGQIIIRKRLQSEVQLPPSGKCTLFIDLSDGLLKKKESSGIISLIGGGTSSGINYFWNSQLEQDNTSPSVNESGVRLDVVGRPVYAWSGSAWVFKYNLDGDAFHVSYTNFDNPSLTTVGAALDALLYVPITVELSGGGIYEKGQTVNTVNFSWVVNKTPISQTLDHGIGSVLPGTTTYNFINAGLTSDFTFTITVDDGTNEATDTTDVLFKNRIYWGVGIADQSSDQFILGLGDSELTSSRQRSITVDADVDERIYVVSPVALGMPILSVNNFVGGFELVATVNHTNVFGHSEQYYVLQSVQSELGTTTVKIE